MTFHDEPSYLAFARHSVRSNEGVSATIARALVDRIDYDAAALKAARPRQITTREEQVNLPNNTVIRSAQGDILQHFNGYWFAPGSSYRHHLDEVALPALVIHEVQR